MADDRQMPILDHLGELRERLRNAALAVVVGTIACYIFRGNLFGILAPPFGSAFKQAKAMGIEGQLIFTSPIEGFLVLLHHLQRIRSRMKRVTICWIVPEQQFGIAQGFFGAVQMEIDFGTVQENQMVTRRTLEGNIQIGQCFLKPTFLQSLNTAPVVAFGFRRQAR